MNFSNYQKKNSAFVSQCFYLFFFSSVQWCHVPWNFLQRDGKVVQLLQPQIFCFRCFFRSFLLRPYSLILCSKFSFCHSGHHVSITDAVIGVATAAAGTILWFCGVAKGRVPTATRYTETLSFPLSLPHFTSLLSLLFLLSLRSILNSLWIFFHFSQNMRNRCSTGKSVSMEFCHSLSSLTIQDHPCR